MRRLSPTTYFDRYKLSLAQRTLLIPYFGITGLLDPTKGDRIAGLGDVTSQHVLRRLYRDIISTEHGRKLLQDKPLVTSNVVSMNRLQELPENSLGKQYYHYMMNHGFSADERNIVRFAEDSDLAYILARYRQVHDFWHVLADLPPSILGEVALKCVEYQVTGLPVALLGGVVGQLRLTPSELQSFYGVYLPWIKSFEGSTSSSNPSSPISSSSSSFSVPPILGDLLRDGPSPFQLTRHFLSSFLPPIKMLQLLTDPVLSSTRPRNDLAVDLLAFRYEEHLDEDVEHVRQRLRFPIAPKI